MLPFPTFSGYGQADAAALKEAARLLNAAACPVILLGMLASKPSNASALGDFIAQLDAPVVGTFQAAGAVSSHLFENFGGPRRPARQPAGRQAARAADVVITIGYDPVEYDPSLWNKGTDRTIIHVDVLPADLDVCYCPDRRTPGRHCPDAGGH